MASATEAASTSRNPSMRSVGSPAERARTGTRATAMESKAIKPARLCFFMATLILFFGPVSASNKSGSERRERDVVFLRQPADCNGPHYLATSPDRNPATPPDKPRVSEVGNLEASFRMPGALADFFAALSLARG